MQLYTYKCKLIKVVDGDTIDVLVDLGFQTHQERRVRMLGYDASETRTKDLDEKMIGIKQRLWLEIELARSPYLYVQTEKQDNFGRYLGTIYSSGEENINDKFTEVWPESKVD